MHLCIPALFGRHAPELWPQRTANNQPSRRPRESDIVKPPMLLHLSLLSFPGCFLDRSELFRAAGRQNRQFAPARLKLPIETAHIAHALGVDRRICEDDQGRLQPLCPMHSQHADAVPLRGRVADNFNIAPIKPVDKHRSEEHTSELQSLMRSSYAVFCVKKKHTST